MNYSISFIRISLLQILVFVNVYSKWGLEIRSESSRIFSEPHSPTYLNQFDPYICSSNVDKNIGNWDVKSPFDKKNVMTNKNPSNLLKIKRLTNKEKRLLRAGLHYFFL